MTKYAEAIEGMYAMLDWLIDLDTALFLALQQRPLLDGLMWWVSVPWVWVPLYLFMLWRLAQTQANWQPQVAMVVGIALCVTAATWCRPKCSRASVGRLRPSHEPALSADIHLLEERPGQTYTGGRYGFVSSHAANHMGIAVLMGSLLGGLWLRGGALGCVDWLESDSPRSALPRRRHVQVDRRGGTGRGRADLRRTLKLARPMTPTLTTWLAVFLGGGLGSVLRCGRPRAGVHLVAFRRHSLGRLGPTSWPQDS